MVSKIETKMKNKMSERKKLEIYEEDFKNAILDSRNDKELRYFMKSLAPHLFNEKPFPKYMKSKRYGTIVLFLNKRFAITVIPSPELKEPLGLAFDNLEISNFEDTEIKENYTPKFRRNPRR